MSYTAYEWKAGEDGGTPITYTRLNLIEQALEAVSTQVERRNASLDGWANFLTNWHAVNDGITDVGFVLNQALAAGGLLYLPPGDYLVNDQLSMNSSIPTILTGPGRILSYWNGPALVVNDAAHVVEGVTIQGVGATLDFQSGIIVYSDNVVVRNCTISSVAGSGIFVQGNDAHIEDNTLLFCSLGRPVDDPSVTSTIYVTGNNVKTINNTLTGTRTGITYTGTGYDAPIVGGLIQGNRAVAQDGVPVDAQGIVTTYARYARVVNNDVSGYPGNSIHQYGGQFTVIAENNCYDGQADGIFVGHELTRHVDVTSNNVATCSTGIRLWDNATNIEVDGNSIADCAIGILAYGAILPGEQPLNNIRIESNTIATDGSQVGGVGVGVTNVNGYTVADNTILNPNHQGVHVSGTSTLGKVVDNTIRGASVDPNGSWAAIHIEGPAIQVLIDDNILAGPTEVGIQLDAGVAGVRVRGNRWTSDIATGLLDNSASGTGVLDNVSF